MLFSTTSFGLYLTSTLPLVHGFTSDPRLKQLAKIDSQNPIDFGVTPGNDAGDDSFELIGDLVGKPYHTLTPVGRIIRDLLLELTQPESDIRYIDVPELGSPECSQDKCCVWKHIADEMAELFTGESGRCSRWARMAVRLGFHDAATWTRSNPTDGGADGSICLTDEIEADENNGLEDICVQMQAWYDDWHNERGYDISMADLIQMGANVAAVVCPLGPRTRSFIGRKDSTERNRVELLPNVHAPADDLIRLFRDKTISPHALVSLVGAHTTSQQRNVNASLAGAPQDSTPGVWDVKFYQETDGTVEAPEAVFMFPSDVAISQHPSTSDEWSAFSGVKGQDHWNRDYASAYIRLSLLGVQNLDSLTECTRSLPRRTDEFENPDQERLSRWLVDSVDTPKSEMIAVIVEEGDLVPNAGTLLPRRSFPSLGNKSPNPLHVKY